MDGRYYTIFLVREPSLRYFHTSLLGGTDARGLFCRCSLSMAILLEELVEMFKKRRNSYGEF